MLPRRHARLVVEPQLVSAGQLTQRVAGVSSEAVAGRGLVRVEAQAVIVIDRGLPALDVVINVPEHPGVLPHVADEHVADHDGADVGLPVPRGLVKPAVSLRHQRQPRDLDPGEAGHMISLNQRPVKRDPGP